jgi:hypothetical protein
MTRGRQQVIFDGSIVTDLRRAPADFLAEVRASVDEYIARHEAQRCE